jgi:hypothetical protein
LVPVSGELHVGLAEQSRQAGERQSDDREVIPVDALYESPGAALDAIRARLV